MDTRFAFPTITAACFHSVICVFHKLLIYSFHSWGCYLSIRTFLYLYWCYFAFELDTSYAIVYRKLKCSANKEPFLYNSNVVIITKVHAYFRTQMQLAKFKISIRSIICI